jgi:hypothetical protein
MGLAWYFYAILRRSGTQAQPLFADSVAALQEDLRQLQEATRRG